MLTVDEAYEKAYESGVWLQLPPDPLRLVRLTGEQRIWFLQNTITADVEGVEPGRWVESCFLDPKGRLLAQMRVGVLPNEVILDISSENTTKLVDDFVRYRFRTKVEFEKLPRPCFVVLGPAATAWAPPGELKIQADSIVFGSVFGDLPVAYVHAAQPPMAGPEAPSALYDVVRVEAGVGAFGRDYNARNLPQEAGLARTLSVEKGCYVGQETIARIHFRGHVNRVVRSLVFDVADPKDVRGRELTWEGKAIGRVTSAERSPREGVVGLGMVRVEPPAGARLGVEGGTHAVLGPIPEGTKVKTQDRA